MSSEQTSATKGNSEGDLSASTAAVGRIGDGKSLLFGGPDLSTEQPTSVRDSSIRMDPADPSRVVVIDDAVIIDVAKPPWAGNHAWDAEASFSLNREHETAGIAGLSRSNWVRDRLAQAIGEGRREKERPRAKQQVMKGVE